MSQNSERILPTACLIMSPFESMECCQLSNAWYQENLKMTPWNCINRAETETEVEGSSNESDPEEPGKTYDYFPQ